MNDALNASVQIQGLDLVILRDLLLRAGWDAIVSDLLGEMAARFDRPPGDGVWTLVIDRAGRFKFKSTRVSAGPVKTQHLRRGRAFALSVEDKQILTITGRLDSEKDVEPILQDLQLLVHGREALADRTIADEDSD